MSKRITDTAGVADYLHTTISHIRRLRWLNEIPATRVGGCVRYDLDTIDIWLSEHSEGPRSG